ncbi:unnamed protein product [Citrullus colocynthis]|uniref:Uncharacterized protein n=1 Tax=Citrullus colocynthis TaxID=252529 RepID=A0ABP0Y2R3_9ROSI
MGGVHSSVLNGQGSVQSTSFGFDRIHCFFFLFLRDALSVLCTIFVNLSAQPPSFTLSTLLQGISLSFFSFSSFQLLLTERVFADLFVDKVGTLFCNSSPNVNRFFFAPRHILIQLSSMGSNFLVVVPCYVLQIS